MHIKIPLYSPFAKRLRQRALIPSFSWFESKKGCCTVAEQVNAELTVIGGAVGARNKVNPTFPGANPGRCSRIVILPDYQGIGLGTRFLNVIAEYYKKQGYDFRIVTSAKNMIYALNKSSKWKMVRWSVSKLSTKENAIDKGRKSLRNNCMTARFKYE